MRASSAILVACFLGMSAILATTLVHGAETPAGESPVVDDAPVITVDHFSFVGNTLFDNEELLVVVLHYLGKPISVEELYEAADELTLFYRNKGYGLASVILPPQDVGDGNILFEVLEGLIGQVEITGDTNYSYEQLNNRLPSIIPGSVFNAPGLQRDLLAMNDLPGIAARAVIAPGTTYGESKIELRLEEDAWQFTTALDNYGRGSLGEYRMTLHMRANNPFTLGDTLQVAFLVSEDDLLRYGNVEYGLPLFMDNDRLSFTINRADYAAGAEFEALGVVGENNFTELAYRWPLHRSDDARLFMHANVRRFESFSEVRALPLPPVESELTVAELGLGGRIEGESGMFAGSLYASGNGRHNRSSVFIPDTDAQHLKLGLDLNTSWNFNSKWWLSNRFSAAYSHEPLVDTQQFSVGGPASVRGHDPAVARGDAGYFLNLELHRYIEWFNTPGSISLQADRGRSFRRLLIGEPDSADRGLNLSSAGVGLQLGDKTGFRMLLAIHHPISNTPDHLAIDDSTKAWASIGYQF